MRRLANISFVSVVAALSAIVTHYGVLTAQVRMCTSVACDVPLLNLGFACCVFLVVLFGIEGLIGCIAAYVVLALFQGHEITSLTVAMAISGPCVVYLVREAFAWFGLDVTLKASVERIVILSLMSASILSFLRAFFGSHFLGEHVATVQALWFAVGGIAGIIALVVSALAILRVFRTVRS